MIPLRRRACHAVLVIVLPALLLGLLAPSGVAAAGVVNGDFESGNLDGWHVSQATQAGNWFVRKGTEAPIGGKRGAAPVQPPPHGAYAAIADEANPDTLILYQDVAIEAGGSQVLGLTAYYDSYKPIAIPSPDTLSVDFETLGGQKNQQFRIDVMKPEAPLESLNPADILRTLFATKQGGPVHMGPTRFTADLSPFAGQTVRLRIAVAAHEEVLNAGVDDVSLGASGAGGSKPGGSHAKFSVGRAKPNRHNGTATLPVRVSGPGQVSAKGKGIAPAKATAHKAGALRLLLKPTRATLAALRHKHKLRVKVTVSYEPPGEAAEALSVPVVLKLRAGKR